MISAPPPLTGTLRRSFGVLHATQRPSGENVGVFPPTQPVSCRAASESSRRTKTRDVPLPWIVATYPIVRPSGDTLTDEPSGIVMRCSGGRSSTKRIAPPPPGASARDAPRHQTHREYQREQRRTREGGNEQPGPPRLLRDEHARVLRAVWN